MKKLVKLYDSFCKSTTGLIVLMIVSIIAGLGLLITPENTSHIIIRGVGFLWILEGITYMGKLLEKYINKRIENRRDL